MVVGPEAGLYRDRVWLSRVNYVLGSPPSQPLEVGVKIRYQSQEAQAVLHPSPEAALLCFDSPQRAVTPGRPRYSTRATCCWGVASSREIYQGPRSFSNPMPDLSLEHRFHALGYPLVAGVDEAGRGPLAGPVVSAAVILPPGLTGFEPWLDLLDDSKVLSAAQRERAAEAVRRNALAVGLGQVTPQEIDQMGIGQAAIQAMMLAVADLPVKPNYLLLDYVPLRECALPFQSIVRGDGLSYSIAGGFQRGQGNSRPLDARSGCTVSGLSLRSEQRLSHSPAPLPAPATGPMQHPPAVLRSGAGRGAALGHGVICLLHAPGWVPGENEWRGGSSKTGGTG